MSTAAMLNDIQRQYLDFLQDQHYPKLDSLNNWGKNRIFFSKHFRLIEDWHLTEQIVIEFNQNYYSLDTGSAPDFMDRELYLAWLKAQLEMI